MIAALFAFLAASGPTQVSALTLLPVEQCSQDRGFEAFRAELRRVIGTRDREFLLNLLSPDILVNFGGESGRDAFAKHWSFDPDEYGNIWDQLETMMRMGCARSNGARVIPSMSAQVETDADEDWFDKVVLLPGAKLYKETGVESPNPSTVPWTVVPVISKAGDLVTGVRLPDGREGYISDGDLYSPLGYRMVIEWRVGKWMVTAFVAGD